MALDDAIRDPLLAEIQDVLSRPRLVKRHGLDGKSGSSAGSSHPVHANAAITRKARVHVIAVKPRRVWLRSVES